VPPRQRPTATTPTKRKPHLTNQPPYQLHQHPGAKSESPETARFSRERDSVVETGGSRSFR
jgi:hypothetical protein